MKNFGSNGTGSVQSAAGCVGPSRLSSDGSEPVQVLLEPNHAHWVGTSRVETTEPEQRGRSPNIFFIIIIIKQEVRRKPKRTEPGRTFLCRLHVHTLGSDWFRSSINPTQLLLWVRTRCWFWFGKKKKLQNKKNRQTFKSAEEADPGSGSAGSL